MTKGSIHQEDRATICVFVCVCPSNNGATTYLKHIQREKDNSAITVGDFGAPLKWIDHQDRKPVYRTSHPQSSRIHIPKHTQNILQIRSYMQSTKQVLFSKFKNLKSYQLPFSDLDGMELEIINRRKTGKFKNV